MPGVLGVHALRTRRSGQTPVIQMHLQLEDELPLMAAHQISSAVEDAVLALFPQADITIHQDPVSLGLEGDQS